MARRGFFERFTRSQSQLDADQLEDRAAGVGATHIRDCVGGTAPLVTGRLRSVTRGPVSTAPSVEAELGDGTGPMTLVLLGRRRIPGISPGRHIVVHGRPICRDGQSALVNPRSELLPTQAE
jgi:hypothetical protein